MRAAGPAGEEKVLVPNGATPKLERMSAGGCAAGIGNAPASHQSLRSRDGRCWLFVC